MSIKFEGVETVIVLPLQILTEDYLILYFIRH